ncbi:glycosyltransferase family 2 protein [Klebsiella pneumoniae]|uniref:glycosyltransferase family 2 protein n=1 Tax=Klebsiella pneumoniae TaxID=573 RepID=UPI000BB3B05C|nr:glycosyltransferase [Klebsiella pneumoniae]PAX10290.1 rhamnosyltransferase [Klebsiella pneumoniae]PIK02971.1 glycosyltransferase family 2 protein [Klebsiella pneumoniae]ULJ01447.1 glycosyltransferase family 2 protein [Klebsiella pneumoniae]
MKVYISIPTYNGGEVWRQASLEIKKNTDPNTFVQIIDSGSQDNTVKYAADMGFAVHEIDSTTFNHGGTRNLSVRMHEKEFDIVVFLTQDAIPESDFLKNIINVFNDPLIVCAFGRQLPHSDASPLAQHARLFNYSPDSYIASLEDVERMGLKTVFASNSFSAYRVEKFIELGAFPEHTILSEDMYFAATAIKNGYKVAYVSNAIVKHSHNYTFIDEFKRYFDIGVFHADEPWIRNEFGGAGGEGIRFVISEFKFLFNQSILSIPKSLVNNISKILGYKLGQHYKKLPVEIVKKISMHHRYWK